MTVRCEPSSGVIYTWVCETIMARCHQWHNIPWQALVDCLEVLYFRNNPSPAWLQAKTCETEEDLVRRDKKLCFFISRLEATIAEFAATERRKYDVKAILKRDKVFDDQYLNDILTPEYQSVEFWLRRQKIRSDPYDRREETNVINELFNANNMEAILLLVHIGIGIQDHERRSTHCHGFGFSNMAEDCLDVYVQLNYLISSGDIYLPHRWNNRWQLCVPSDCHCDCRRVLRKHLTGIQGGFTDYCGVTELLQYCFRFCYQYTMIRDEIRGMNALDPDTFDTLVRTYWDPLGFRDVSYNPFGFTSVPHSWRGVHKTRRIRHKRLLSSPNLS